MKKAPLTDYEVLTDAEIAGKLKCSLRLIRALRNASQTPDPIPSIRLGKSYRYLWGSPEMNAWLQRKVSKKVP